MNNIMHTIEWKSVIVAAATFAIIGTAQADSAMATKNGCMACHAVDRKLLGPSYQDIAKKYQGQADAPVKLAKKIQSGGAGVWGPIPMPAHPRLSETDARTLAEWILKTK
jgi:cytochrome c